jgi:hypothetical protein
MVQETDVPIVVVFDTLKLWLGNMDVLAETILPLGHVGCTKHIKFTNVPNDSSSVFTTIMKRKEWKILK